RGEVGTVVKLTIVRSNSEEIDVEIKRATITIPSVEHEILQGDIGYLRVSRFGEDTSQLAQRAATSFRGAGVKGVIVDLRGNPGGLVSAAVDLAGLWLPRGATILEEKRGGVTIKTYT